MEKGKSGKRGGAEFSFLFCFVFGCMDRANVFMLCAKRHREGRRVAAAVAAGTFTFYKLSIAKYNQRKQGEGEERL